MSSLLQRLRRRLRSQAGFTLIEVMVAALILVIAFTALATVFINGESQASATVQQSQLINLADQQIESVRAQVAAQGFPPLAMNYATAPSFSAGNPNAFIAGGCLEIANNYDAYTTAGLTSAPVVTPPSQFTAWANCPNAYSEPLEVVPGGTSANGTNLNGLIGGSPTSCAAATSNPTFTSPCTATLSGATFTVYTYITDTYSGCTTSGNVICPSVSAVSGVATIANTSAGCSGAPSSSSGTFGTAYNLSAPCADARRVTVAVVPTTNSGTSRHQLQRLTPVYVSAIFTNPTPSTNSSSTSSTVGITLGLSL